MAEFILAKASTHCLTIDVHVNTELRWNKAVKPNIVCSYPRKETADVIANYETLNKQMISVHGIISEVTRGSMSVTTYLIELEGGLKCRLSRDALKSQGKKYNGKPIPVKFQSQSTTGLKIFYDDVLVLNQGTDVIVRGMLKNEMNKWILDKAVIRGCSDETARNLLGVTCGGPCTHAYYFYTHCTICRDPQN